MAPTNGAKKYSITTSLAITTTGKRFCRLFLWDLTTASCAPKVYSTKRKKSTPARARETLEVRSLRRTSKIGRPLSGLCLGGLTGKGYPGWYTRVEFYKGWIQCIIDKSVQFNNEFAKVDAACTKLARQSREKPDCEKLVADPDVALFDLRGIEPAEICLPYETGTFARADDEPKTDTEIFGETPSAGFSDTGTDDYDYYDGDDIFGGGEDAAGGDDYAEDEIFGDR